MGRSQASQLDRNTEVLGTMTERESGKKSGLTEVTFRAKMTADDVLDLRNQCGQIFRLADVQWSQSTGEAELRFTVKDGLMLLQQLSGEYFDEKNSK